MPLWFTFEYAAPHVIAYYNFTPYADFLGNNSWYILGTNNGVTRVILDERTNVSMTSGETYTFNLTVTGAYKYYDVFLIEGFSTSGDKLEVHMYTSTGEEPRMVYAYAAVQKEPVYLEHLILAIVAFLAVAGWSSAQNGGCKI
jgi:hypothetical protein